MLLRLVGEDKNVAPHVAPLSSSLLSWMWFSQYVICEAVRKDLRSITLFLFCARQKLFLFGEHQLSAFYSKPPAMLILGMWAMMWWHPLRLYRLLRLATTREEELMLATLRLKSQIQFWCKNFETHLQWSAIGANPSGPSSLAVKRDCPDSQNPSSEIFKE